MFMRVRRHLISICLCESVRLIGALLAVCIASLAVVASASAQQTAFRQQASGSDTRFAYGWKDAGGEARQLAFSLPTADIEAAMDLFRDYSMPQLYAHVEQALGRDAERAGVRLQVRRTAEGTSFTVLAANPARGEAFYGRMDRIIENARQEWLHKHARRAVGPAIHMNYVTATQRYVAPLRPVAAALAAQLAGESARQHIARALGFVQAIPYDDLTDPRTTGGIEFAPPPAMFRLNRGDCDSKTVALAAILRSLLPRQRLLFVVLPQHVALAVDLVPREGEAAVTYDGRTWLLLEPTGPAVVPPGQVAPTTAWYMGRPEEITFFELKE